jgi:large subunit ribosomal protein L6
MSTEGVSAVARIPLPERASLFVEGRTLSVRGPLGAVRRPFPSDVVHLEVKGREVVLTLGLAANRKRSQALLRAWAAHVANLATGVTVGFEAKMKVVAAHFPMKVAVKDDHLVIENFLGEKHPRTAVLVPGVSAAVEGDYVTISGPDVELVGQSCANIERATHIREYDPRVFQDGIYLVERAHPKGGAE